jgi:hypothetical protein
MPKALATVTKDGLIAVACTKDLVMLKDGRIVSTVNVGYEPSSVAIHPDGTQIAVGGSMVSTPDVVWVSSFTFNHLVVQDVKNEKAESKLFLQKLTFFCFFIRSNGHFLS